MTERGRAAIERSADSFAIGPSRMAWDGDALVYEINEITVPIPSRIQGRVRVEPLWLSGRSFALDREGRHVWAPVAPAARVQVSLQNPQFSWAGEGYIDSNWGTEPIENGFSHWTWSRATTGEGVSVLYDVTERQGRESALAFRFRNGNFEQASPPPEAALPGTFWRMQRLTRADRGEAKLLKTLENAPFYARSLIRSQVFGEEATAVHESLSLDRFRMPVVQAMLPFRMPRRTG